MNANEKNNIKRCLTCPIGHRIIEDFFNLYPILTKKLSKKHLSTDETENKDHYIESISSTLMLSKPYEDNENLISTLALSKKLLSKEVTQKQYKNLDNLCCFYALNNILYPLKLLLQESDPENKTTKKDSNAYYYQIPAELPKKAIDILLIMEEVLEENNQSLESELTSDEEQWSKIFREEAQLDQIKELYHKLHNILQSYCTIPDGGLKYKFCGTMYSVSNKLGYKCRDCYFEDFQKYISAIQSYHNISDDLECLTPDYVKIAQRYLVEAPKKFGAVVSKVMDYQGLTSQKVAKLWNDPKKRASTINGYKENDTHELSDTELNVFLKILLVSEDMLTTGTGKVFGNWNHFIDIPTGSDDLKILQEHYKTKSVSILKNSINNDILHYICNTDDFASMVTANSDSFYEENVCLYSYEVDSEIYYDYQAMYDDLLHSEEFDVLLSVLKKLQSKEEKTNHD